MPISYNFGDICVGYTSFYQEITVQNSGPNSIEFSISVSDSFIEVSESSGSVGPSPDTFSFNARIDTDGLSVGSHNGAITLTPINGTCSIGGAFQINVSFTIVEDGDPGSPPGTGHGCGTVIILDEGGNPIESSIDLGDVWVDTQVDYEGSAKVEDAENDVTISVSSPNSEISVYTPTLVLPSSETEIPYSFEFDATGLSPGAYTGNLKFEEGPGSLCALQRSVGIRSNIMVFNPIVHFACGTYTKNLTTAFASSAGGYTIADVPNDPPSVTIPILTVPNDFGLTGTAVSYLYGSWKVRNRYTFATISSGTNLNHVWVTASGNSITIYFEVPNEVTNQDWQWTAQYTFRVSATNTSSVDSITVHFDWTQALSIHSVQCWEISSVPNTEGLVYKDVPFSITWPFTYHNSGPNYYSEPGLTPYSGASKPDFAWNYKPLSPDWINNLNADLSKSGTITTYNPYFPYAIDDFNLAARWSTYPYANGTVWDSIDDFWYYLTVRE